MKENIAASADTVAYGCSHSGDLEVYKMNKRVKAAKRLSKLCAKEMAQIQAIEGQLSALRQEASKMDKANQEFVEKMAQL